MAGKRQATPPVRRVVSELEEQSYFYPRGEGELKFNDNTSPYGPSPSVRSLMGRSVVDIIGGFGESTFYPDQSAAALRKDIAAAEGVDAEGIVVGCGADELLDILFRVFIEAGDTVTAPVPAYFMFEHFARLSSATVAKPPMGRPPSLPPPEPGSTVYIISNPNNPTGAIFAEKEMLDIVDSFPGLVIVDEAYAEYSGRTLARETATRPNLVVVRTFSKIHGLPNFRIGYSISSVEIALEMRKVKNPFNVTTVSQKLASVAVKDREFVEHVRAENEVERGRLRRSLESMGLAVFDSSANFLLVDAGSRRDALVAGLAGKGVYVKEVTEPFYEKCIRITVRSRDENSEMLSRLGDVLAAL